MKRPLLALACFVLLLTACVAENEPFTVTEALSPEQIYAMIESAEESLRAVTTAAETEPPPPVTASLAPAETVYWSPSGEVWHTTPDCSSLRQAKSVLSGSTVDAMAAGKDRVCRTCGETDHETIQGDNE